MEDKYIVEKLTDSNWSTWKFQVEHLLKAKNQWKHVEKPSEEPTSRDAEKAFSTIVLSISSSLLYLITSCKSGNEAWEKLKTHFDRSTTANKLYLKKAYFRCQMSEGSKVEDHLRKMKELTDAMAAIDVVIHEEDQVITLLGSLPPSYSTLVTALEARSEDLELEFVQQALLNEQQKRTSKAVAAEAAEDSRIMKVQSQSGAEKMFKFEGTCFKCGKKGHMKKDCRVKVKKKEHVKIVKGRAEDPSHGDYYFKLDDSSKPTVDQVVKSDPRKLLVDCGATAHIVTTDCIVDEDETFEPSNHYIELADGSKRNNVAVKKGDAKVSLTDDCGNVVNATLKNALFIPTYPTSIFSVQCATDNGAEVHFGDEHCLVASGKRFPIVKEGRLFYLHVSHGDSIKVARSLNEWHKILGHCNADDIAKLEPIVDNMCIDDGCKPIECEPCIISKQSNVRNHEPRKRAKKPLALIHTDLAGPMSTVGKGNFRYVIMFTDDFTGCHFAYLLKGKDDAATALEQFLADINQCGSVECLRSDNGTEFTAERFQSVLRRNKIRYQTSSPHSPHQNGVAERSWRTIFEMARTMLIDADLPKSFWPYAVHYAVYLRNRCFNNRIRDTPFHAMTGERPDMSKLHIFGCRCYVYQHGHKGKFDARCIKGIFLGKAKRSPGYLVYSPDHGNVKEYRIVRFLSDANVSESTVNIETQNEMSNPIDDPVPVETTPTQTSCEEGESRFPKRKSQKPAYLNDYVTQTIDYLCFVVDVPQSYEEAISSEHASDWKAAMQSEIDSLRENDTWTLEKVPDDQKPINGKWVYACKSDKDGNVTRFKARYVAQGYSQTYGQNFIETFSPTVKMSTVRALTQVAVSNDWVIKHIDVKTAYLHAPIDYDIYISQPKGFEVGGPDIYCHLRKGLYGLKQSGRLWYGVLHDFFCDSGFTRSDVDHCLYTKSIRGQLVRIAVFVDDMIIVGHDDLVCDVIAELKRNFRISDLGDLEWFLGIEFRRQDGVMTMNQSLYLEKLLEKYHMENCRPVATPCIEKGSTLEVDDDEPCDVSNETYRSVVGSLSYAAVCTRPDIQWVVSLLSRYLNQPVTHTRWIAVKRVLRYLKGTLHYALALRKSETHLNGFCDASWAEASDRKSTTGYCFSIGDTLQNHINLISWRSKRQTVVALSTCESEYIAMSTAVQELLYLKQLLSDIVCGSQSDKCVVTLSCDNQSAISIAHNPVQHDRSKHIDIRYHFVRDHIEKDFQLCYVSSENMVADILTKPVGKGILSKFCHMFFVTK